MLALKDYLKDNVLLTDGAMGTYYSQITTHHTTLSEWANQTDPARVRDIHRAYIQAGAQLIRTNTFSVNRFTLQVEDQEVLALLTRGYEIAQEAAKGHSVYIAADIGPIPETMESDEVGPNKVLQHYLYICDCFLTLGAEVFIFETLSSLDYIREASRYIKERNPEAFILTQFALTPDGTTRQGIGNNRLLSELMQIPDIDAYGFNCGVGPAHLYQLLKRMDRPPGIFAALPNAGYPEIFHARTVYTQNPDYFADIMVDIKDLGFRIIGGYCGTTPAHIKKMATRLKGRIPVMTVKEENKKVLEATLPSVPNDFKEKLRQNQFTITVELEPPLNIHTDKLIQGAEVLRNCGVDLITLADSPLARVRMDALMLAARIKREVGIDTMPHLCCRDRNIISIKSSVMAVYTEGIRNILIITGDPIPSAERSEVKSVFNLNALNLMALLHEMNGGTFSQDPLHIGGALNLNVSNVDAEFNRMKRKVDRGACFFLTQPLFEDATIEHLVKIKAAGPYKIIAGIMPLVSYRNAMFLNNEIPGISVPAHCLNQFHPDMPREEAEAVGISIAQALTKKIRGIADGFYFITPFNRIQMMKKIIDSL